MVMEIVVLTRMALVLIEVMIDIVGVMVAMMAKNVAERGTDNGDTVVSDADDSGFLNGFKRFKDLPGY